MEHGIYEQVISNKLKSELDRIPEDNKFIEHIDSIEAPSILSDYVGKAVKKYLQKVSEKVENGDASVDTSNINEKNLAKQVRIVNELLGMLDDSSDELVSDRGEQLKAISYDEARIRLSGITATKLPRPETSIANSSLFTSSGREPKLYTELAKEIESSDEIDILVSFIKWSGILLIINELKEFTERGGKLRVLTSTYMAATEPKAIVELSKLRNTEIKISYDTEHTRMHAKAYIFKRNSGFSTAYIGSSNISNPAMSSGLEWNMKISRYDMSDVYEKTRATFDVYWNSEEFEMYSDENYDKLCFALRKDNQNVDSENSRFFFDIRPYPYQQMILDKLDAERNNQGIWRNLVVAATGTGKTIIAAFDYKAQCQKANRKINLLFICHRQEILEQSRECFREVLKDHTFGGLLVGNSEPEDINHLFASVQMINSRKLWELVENNRYEMIILDECHHMSANSYQPIMKQFNPKIFLGLTATPERMDGGNILEYFDNRISAEIRLTEAINRKLLCPFQYYGIADTVDLKDVKWARGGYDVGELENIFVFSKEIAKKRARHIISTMDSYVSDMNKLKAIAFCVSKEHAIFMSDMFSESGIKSEYIVSGVPNIEAKRKQIKTKLQSGEVKIVCVVDIFNEGVDIKDINTVLFLRPTESLTVFLQQLGRGLRHAEGKDCLTVLDYVGHANKRYSFEGKYTALIDQNNQGIKREVETDFPHLPLGCYIKLEKKVKEVILENIRRSIGTKNGLYERVKFFEDDTGHELNLYNFLNYYQLDPRVIYRNKQTFAQMVKESKAENSDIHYDKNAWRQINHLSQIDSKGWIEYILNHIDSNESYNDCSELEKQYWKMLCASFFEKGLSNDLDFREKALGYLRKDRLLIQEIKDLLRYRLDTIDVVAGNNDLPYVNALEPYCTYTRAQALASLDYWNISSEGSTRQKEKKTTCLFITLNKSNNYYSPSTSYHDYSINSWLFHWQTQNATAPDSTVGKRYINHRYQHENILLFVREAKEDRFGSISFTYLGAADYVSHEGSKPMSIVWKLHNQIPAKFMKVTDKLGIG